MREVKELEFAPILYFLMIIVVKAFLSFISSAVIVPDEMTPSSPLLRERNR